MPYIQLHPRSQIRGNIRKSLESRLVVPKDVLYVLVLLRTQSCGSPLFEAEVVLKILLVCIEVELAVREPLLVGVFFDQTCVELRTDI